MAAKPFGRMLVPEKKGCMPIVLFAILIGASALLSACGTGRKHLNTAAAIESAAEVEIAKMEAKARADSMEMAVRIAKMEAKARADSTKRAIAIAVRLQKEQEKVEVALFEAQRDSIRRASRNAGRPVAGVAVMPVASVSWRLTTEMEDGRITDRVTDSSGYVMTDGARKHVEKMANIDKDKAIGVAKQRRIAMNPCGGIRYWLPECPPRYGYGSTMMIGGGSYGAGGVNGVGRSTVAISNQLPGSVIGGTNGVGRGTVAITNQPQSNGIGGVNGVFDGRVPTPPED